MELQSNPSQNSQNKTKYSAVIIHAMGSDICYSCSLYSSGNFPGVWGLKADVSGLNVGPIVLGDQAFKPQTPGKFPEEYKLHSEHGESLKTTICYSCYYNVELCKIWCLMIYGPCIVIYLRHKNQQDALFYSHFISLLTKITVIQNTTLNLIGANTLCYNNIGNLLPSRDTTILVKIWQQIVNKTLRRHVSAINSHHQAKLEQRLGTWVVCTLWDPISFTIVVY